MDHALVTTRSRHSTSVSTLIADIFVFTALLRADVGVALSCGWLLVINEGRPVVPVREGRLAEVLTLRTGVARGAGLAATAEASDLVTEDERAGVVEGVLFAHAGAGRRGVTLLSLGVELKML